MTDYGQALFDLFAGIGFLERDMALATRQMRKETRDTGQQWPEDTPEMVKQYIMGGKNEQRERE